MAGLKRKASAASPSSPDEKPRTPEVAVTASDTVAISRKKTKAALSRRATTTRRITRQMTTDGPRKAAFLTAEILENILMFLSPRNIFGVQRVSKQFRDVIATSPDIQTKLFLRPSGQPAETWTGRIISTWSVLVERVPKVDSRGSERVTASRLNPLLARENWGEGRSVYKTHKFVSFNPGTPYTVGKHESWMNTLVCDPPGSEFIVEMTVQYKPRAGGKRVTHCIQADVSPGQPCTLGALLEAVSKKPNSFTWPTESQVSASERPHRSTLENFARFLKREVGHPLVNGPLSIHIEFKDVVVATEQEWENGIISK